MSLRRFALACAVGLCLGAAPEVSAHGVPPGTGTLRLNGDRVFSILSFPVSQLSRGDDDGDGRLSAGELQRHRASITAEVRERLRVESGREQGEVMFEDLLLPHAEDGSAEVPPATHLGVMRSTRFAHAVTAPRLVVRAFEGAEAQSTFHASFLDERGGLLERTTLSRAAPAWRFGAGRWEVARLHARGAAQWLGAAWEGWALLLGALAAGALLRRPGWALLAASACGLGALRLHGFAEQARSGHELPHALAGVGGAAAVLGGLAVVACGLGRAAARR